MAIYSSDSLATLREKIDLVELLSSHLSLKRTGAFYQGLCPFHDEKTPSFSIRQGDRHYHCFGCGAHGDAIEFLMSHQQMTFHEAITTLAERFGVQLVQIDEQEERGPSKEKMRQALEFACNLYHFLLLNSHEGKAALAYLEKRGIDRPFIEKFRIGLAPKAGGVLFKVLAEKRIPEEVSLAAGLIKPSRRDFFVDRITFPIQQPSGAVVGFSARKYREETPGGKYLNTPETPLFKKSRLLFGLNYSRRKIAKERKALIVEGQIDALRLIAAGFDWAVAAQGTAFGEGHVRELMQLGVRHLFLALDSDKAGKQAALKIGDLFAKEGVEVQILDLPAGEDPDSLIRTQGASSFDALIKAATPYLSFLIDSKSEGIDLTSPATKSAFAAELTRQIRQWQPALMVHESLRQLAHLLQVPEEMVGVGQQQLPNLHIRQYASAGTSTIPADRILESDLLRWLILGGAERSTFIEMAKKELEPKMLLDSSCRKLFTALLSSDLQESRSLMDWAQDEELQQLIDELSKKRIDPAKARSHFCKTLEQILTRNWMAERERLSRQIATSNDEEEATKLLQLFGELTKKPPKIAWNT